MQWTGLQQLVSLNTNTKSFHNNNIMLGLDCVPLSSRLFPCVETCFSETNPPKSYFLVTATPTDLLTLLSAPARFWIMRNGAWMDGYVCLEMRIVRVWPSSRRRIYVQLLKRMVVDPHWNIYESTFGQQTLATTDDWTLIIIQRVWVLGKCEWIVFALMSSAHLAGPAVVYSLNIGVSLNTDHPLAKPQPIGIQLAGFQ